MVSHVQRDLGTSRKGKGVQFRLAELGREPAHNGPGGGLESGFGSILRFKAEFHHLELKGADRSQERNLARWGRGLWRRAEAAVERAVVAEEAGGPAPQETAG